MLQPTVDQTQVCGSAKVTGAHGFQRPQGAIPTTLCLYRHKVKSEPGSEAVPFRVPNYATSYPQLWPLNAMGVWLRPASNSSDSLLHYQPKIR